MILLRDSAKCGVPIPGSSHGHGRRGNKTQRRRHYNNSNNNKTLVHYENCNFRV